MKTDQFYRDTRLPYVECRYTAQSTEVYRPHLHSEFCIGAAEKGDIVFSIGGEEIALGKNTLALINPETVHACNPVTARPRSYYMLHLDRQWCTTVQQSLWATDHFVEVDTATVRDPDLYCLFRVTVSAVMSSCHLLEKEQMLASLAEAIFTRCCHPSVPIPETDNTLEELRKWLADDLSEDCTVEQFALKMGRNPYTLLRNFRSAFGITPYAYRTNCRIDHGRKLLQQGVSIGDAAQQCGFFDQSHFHRHFKAMTSVTPLGYQKNFQTV